jgi:hypothetical protein
VKTRYAGQRIDYTGRELRSGWLKETFGLDGDAIAAFTGSCDVSGEDLVDLEDYRLGNVVAGDRMLHFIVEIFRVGLPGIVFAQRLLCGIAKEILNRSTGGETVVRVGDDLYVGNGKLSVSVATASPVSGLIHLGLNIDREGVPVEAAGLADIGIDHTRLARQVITAFASEIDSCRDAATKVRPVV